MENTITPEQRYLRPTMIPSMLEVLEKNAPFYDTLRLFDCGNTWTLNNGKTQEHTIATLLRYGSQKNNWQQD